MTGSNPTYRILLSSILGFIIGFVIVTAIRYQQHLSKITGNSNDFNTNIFNSFVSLLSSNGNENLFFEDRHNHVEKDVSKEVSIDINTNRGLSSEESSEVIPPSLSAMSSALPQPILKCPVSIPYVSEAVSKTVVNPIEILASVTKSASKDKIFFDQDFENLPRFYIHENKMASIDVKLLLGCLQNILRVKPRQGENAIDLGDLALAANIEQGISKYLSDAIFIEALKKHPSRVYDKEAADFFIFPFSPILSYMMPPNPTSYGCKLKAPTHEHRMSVFSRKVKELAKLKEQNGYNHVLFCSGCTPSILTSDVTKQIKNDIIVGTRPDITQKYGSKKDQPIVPHIYVPDLTTRMLMGKAQGECNIPIPITKRQAYYFLFDLTVNMAWHEDFFNELSSLLPRPFISINHIDDVARSSFLLRSDYTRNHMMAESRFCIILVLPGGNYARLFDAMANGCIPILIASASSVLDKLPFADIINWKEIVIFIDGLGCIREDFENTVLLLKKIADYDDETLLALQQNVINAYNKLKFPNSIDDYRLLISFSTESTKIIRVENSTIIADAAAETHKIDSSIDSGAIWSLIRSIPKKLKAKLPV